MTQVEWKLSRPNLEVVAVEQGYSEHPNPSQNGKLVPFTGLSKLLLTDDTEVFGCNRCGLTDPNPKSVVAHFTSHGERKPSFYTNEKLLTIVKIVQKHKRMRVKGYCEAAARELNAKKIFTHGGLPWTGSSLSNLFRAHAERILEWDAEQRKQRVAERRPVSSAPAPSTVPTESVSQNRTVTVVILQQIAEDLSSAANALRVLAIEVDKNDAGISRTELTALQQKAEKFDQLKGLMK